MSEILGLFEIPQVLMVCDHHYRVFSSSEGMLPFLQSLDDSEKLSIIDIVISFCGGEGGRMIGTRMEVSIGVFLHEYSPRGSEGGISHDKEGFGGVRHFNYQGG